MNKNGNKLLDKISDLDPKLISDAEKKPRAAKRRLFVGITSGMATAAAAAVIAVAAAHNPLPTAPVVSTSAPVISDSASDPVSNSGSASDPVSNSGSASDPVSNSGSTNDSSDIPGDPATLPKDPPKLNFSKYKDLPKISDSNYAVTGQGGSETHYLNSSDLERRGPWNGEELETMPVYMSSSCSLDLDVEHMLEYAKGAAAALGIPENEIEFTLNDYPGEENESYRKIMEDQGVPEEEIERELERVRRISMQSTNVTGTADGVKLELRSDYSLKITFDTPIELPEEYNFTINATEEEKIAALKYLMEQYGDLIEYVDPALADGEGINFNGYLGSVYNSDCELDQQVLNYYVNNIKFDHDEQGKLSAIKISSLEGCEKLGDYPVLTAAQAEAILKSNKYDDKHRMPHNAKILKVDITYSNLVGSTGILPYYNFYVETDKELACDVYTIAAVPEEFIDMETEDYGVRA